MTITANRASEDAAGGAHPEQAPHGRVELPVADLPTGLRIGGEVVRGTADPIDVHDPSTGHLLVTVDGASAADIDRAVATAKATFASGVWRDMPVHDRARVLQRFADGIEARMEDLYRIETRNNGRPITETRA